MLGIVCLSKAIILDTSRNIGAFLINLGLPTGIFVINNIQYFGKHIPEEVVFHGVAIYLSYIIFTTTWNMVIVPLLEMREQGMIKQFSFLTGNLWSLPLANALVQFGLLISEMVIFVCATMVVLKTWSLVLLLTALLSGFLLYLPILALTSIFICWHTPPRTINVVTTLILLILFALSPLQTASWWVNQIFVLNPICYLQKGIIFLSQLLSSHRPEYSDSIVLLFVSILYILIGCATLKYSKMQPVLTRA